MSQAEAKKMQDFAQEQMLKVSDIIKTVRRHHGPSVGDRMTLVANMVSHLHQNIALDAGMMVLAISSEKCTPIKPCIWSWRLATLPTVA
jgi:hypothetical protein